ncbi:hypothetical protein [Microcystis phage MaeS]|nr:hypothetical protein [Microcystis phage MaeS]
MAEANSYLTEDGLIFETLLDIGKVNPKEYPLEVLEMAETRVNRGTNKTLQAAINSIKALKRGKKSLKDDSADQEFDEYGLNEELYTPQQIKFIRSTIQSYYDAHDIATPYQRSGVVRLAKLECSINEVEATIAKAKNKDDITNLKSLQSMHKDLSDALKLQTKQATEGTKGEDAFANACIAFEERFRNDPFEFENIELKDRLMEIMINNAPRIVKLIDESATYFHFKKALADTVALKAHDVNEIGFFTIEELFDFKKIYEDRNMIETKNENTRDDNFVDKDGGLDG